MSSAALAVNWTLDETPAGDGEWGYRPADAAVSETDPPSFSWRPQSRAARWELQCARDAAFAAVEHQAEGIEFNVYCPPCELPAGTYWWRYRGMDKDGNPSNWSRSRTFTVPDRAVAMPMPGREQLLARIPKSHPRLFIRPEQLPELRELAQGTMNDRFQQLVASCEQLLKNPPPTAEPKTYPDDMERGSEQWKALWWGNRMYTIAALDGAATLGFTRLLGGKDEYGQLAKRILLDCAQWDPRGATGYWSSYIGRFTWWADVMRAAFGINAFQKPYFAQVGYYPMYLLPPGKVSGGFGDGANRARAANVVPLMSELAAQARNGHWQWYVEQMGGAVLTPGYVGFVRGTLPKAESTPPAGRPTSRLFRGTGQAYLNTTLLDANKDVQVVFKSSQMGSQSHGNEAHNSFVLWAYGEQLLLRTGHYYLYGGPHHRDWVWSTRSLNNITVNGQGQVKRSASSKGEIVAFQTTPTIDVVVGEAAKAYRASESGGQRRLLERYTRAIVFVKPELVIVFDRLQAAEPSTFEYWLHAANRIQVGGQRAIQVQSGDVVCDIEFLTPEGLTFTQTDQYDPNPWPQIKTREWHLTATTPTKTKNIEFVTLYRPHRKSATPPAAAALKKLDGGYVLTADVVDGRVVALLPTVDTVKLTSDGLTSTGNLVVQHRNADGTVTQTVDVGTADSGR